MLLSNSNSTSYIFTFPQKHQPNSSTFSVPMRAIHKAPVTTLPLPPSWPFPAPLMSFPRHRCLASLFVSVAFQAVFGDRDGVCAGLAGTGFGALVIKFPQRCCGDRCRDHGRSVAAVVVVGTIEEVCGGCWVGGGRCMCPRSKAIPWVFFSCKRFHIGNDLIRIE